MYIYILYNNKINIICLITLKYDFVRTILTLYNSNNNIIQSNIKISKII